MRLTPLQASRVLTRKKSQHRVKSKGRTKIGAIAVVQTERTETNPITQQKERRWATTCHVRITMIYQQDVENISDTEIKAEGFDSREEFLEHWGKHKLCTVLCFEPVERPRYPSAINRFDPEGRGYSSSPSGHDNLAAIDDDTQARFSKEGREKDAERKQAHADEKIEFYRRRIDEIKALAAKDGLDMRSEIRVFERRLQEKLRKKAA